MSPATGWIRVNIQADTLQLAAALAAARVAMMDRRELEAYTLELERRVVMGAEQRDAAMRMLRRFTTLAYERGELLHDALEDESVRDPLAGRIAEHLMDRVVRP